MQLRFFTIPIHGGEDAAAELNRFLDAHRVLALDRQLVADGPNSAWAVCVSFDHGTQRPPPGKRGRVDYRDVLDEPEFAVFARLRALRKELAEAEGVPPYAVFTNEQLAEMVQRRVLTVTALKEIAGIGEARIEKFSEAFFKVLREAALPAAAAAADEA